MIKAYIAAPFTAREKAVEAGKVLAAHGIGMTSRWIYEHPPGGCGAVPGEKCKQEALEDLDDVREADFFVLMNDIDTRAQTMGGMHVETGYAWASGLRIFVVGGGSNVFHALPRVTIVDRVEDIIGLL